MNKKISLGAAIAFMLIVAATTFSMTMIYARTSFNDRVNYLKEREVMYEKFTEIDRQVRLQYNGTISETQLMDSVADGYLKGIGDKYSMYINAEAYKQITTNSGQESVGIGAVFDLDDKGQPISSGGYLVVKEVYTDSPAQVGGIAAGDLIVKIDDTDLTAENCNEMYTKIQGVSGTTITLVVRKGNEDTTVPMTRRLVMAPSVTSQMIPETTTGYIRIVEFNDNTSDQFARELQKVIDAGAEMLVFDVRDNKGGTMKSVTRILDKLAPAGIIAQALYKDGTTQVLATSDANEIDLPMAVIVNGGTASSGELFAQALKDFGKAQIVGSITVGKGVMQNIIRLSDGSAIDLTVAYFTPPSGVSFDGIGVKPDFEVSMEGTVADYIFGQDPQLVKAVEVAVAMMNSENTLKSTK